MRAVLETTQCSSRGCGECGQVADLSKHWGKALLRQTQNGFSPMRHYPQPSIRRDPRTVPFEGGAGGTLLVCPGRTGLEIDRSATTANRRKREEYGLW